MMRGRAKLSHTCSYEAPLFPAAEELTPGTHQRFNEKLRVKSLRDIRDGLQLLLRGASVFLARRLGGEHINDHSTRFETTRYAARAEGNSVMSVACYCMNLLSAIGVSDEAAVADHYSVLETYPQHRGRLPGHAALHPTHETHFGGLPGNVANSLRSRSSARYYLTNGGCHQL